MSYHELERARAELYRVDPRDETAEIERRILTECRRLLGADEPKRGVRVDPPPFTPPGKLSGKKHGGFRRAREAAFADRTPG